MSTYQKTLIALDLRDQQTELIEKVKKVRRDLAEVHLCAAIEPFEMMYPILPLEGSALDGGELQKKIEQRASDDLIALAETLNVRVENTHLLVGKPANQIKAFAEEGEFDLIVVGTHGKSAARAMLGSTSSGVLHGAPCDVLALKYEAH